MQHGGMEPVDCPGQGGRKRTWSVDVKSILRIASRVALARPLMTGLVLYLLLSADTRSSTTR